MKDKKYNELKNYLEEELLNHKNAFEKESQFLPYYTKEKDEVKQTYLLRLKDINSRIEILKRVLRHCKEIEEQEDFDNCENPYDFKKEREV